MGTNRNRVIWTGHSLSFIFNCFLASFIFSKLIYEEGNMERERRTDHKPHILQQEQEEFLPGEQCQTTPMILQSLEFLRTFMILFASDDFSSPVPLIKQMRVFFSGHLSDKSC